MNSRIKSLCIFSTIIILFQAVIAQAVNEEADWVNGIPDGCTSITVGKKASVDGSVTTSHTCDSHRTRSWLNITPPQKHKSGSEVTMVKREKNDSLAMPTYKHIPVGKIPQVRNTHGFINTAYPCMNDHQLAVGESTFGGRKSLRAPEAGMIDCQQLVRLMLERCTTARDAVRLAGEITEKHGYNDSGECLTVADPKEVWHLEIVGPGKGNKGAVWVAQRVPDDHISVCANGSRIRQIDLANSDFFMASENIFQVAQDSGWWNPENGPFEFCYAYAPNNRVSMASRRREWRVFDLAAPSLNLHPNSENYPFSVKPDSLITIADLISIFQDYYQGTEFDLAQNITQVNADGETIVSPFANPFMPYEMNRLFKINGGWSWRGERQIARWYTMYATITQSRDWLPDPIGGLVWLALDNVATSVYIPLYCGITDVYDAYETPGRIDGYTHDSAWWAFNRLGTLTAQRWQDMVKDVQEAWRPVQQEMLLNQKNIEEEAQNLYKKSEKKARQYLTKYSVRQGETVVKKAWKLGNDLWTEYDEKF